MTIKLRSYQDQCLADLARHRAEHPDETRLAVVMATGLGKTITFAAEACDYLDSFNGAGNRVLVLVHTDELTSQAEIKARLVAKDRGGYSVGVVKAGRNEVDADIVIGSVATLANPARRAQLTDVGHIIVDECHHAIAIGYQAILRHYGALPGCICMGTGREFPSESPRHPGGRLRCGRCGGNGRRPEGPFTTVTGYTATLERGDGNSLGSVWQNVAFSRSISWAVRKGFLVPPRAYRVQVPDLDIWNGSGSLSGAELIDRALIDSVAPASVVDAWMEHAGGRSTVLFAPLVRSAEAFSAAFVAAGQRAAVVHGGMHVNDRRRVLARYEAGGLDVLCNAMVLTEGWDSPRTECVIVARPTKSRPLFIQMAGRGLRRNPMNPSIDQDCLLLVVADATTELASIADLSDRPIEAEDGKSLLALEDEWDLSQDLEPDPEHAYDGRVHLEEFDPLVAKSSKIWQTTKGGTLFIPAGGKREPAYVFIVPDNIGWAVASVVPGTQGVHDRRVPDLELAMSLAEDAATDLGGNLTALYADKDRAWRRLPVSQDQEHMALAVGVPRDLVLSIKASKKAGKAGRLSDAIDKARASRRIDPVVARIKSVVPPREGEA